MSHLADLGFWAKPRFDLPRLRPSLKSTLSSGRHRMLRFVKLNQAQIFCCWVAVRDEVVRV